MCRLGTHSSDFRTHDFIVEAQRPDPHRLLRRSRIKSDFGHFGPRRAHTKKRIFFGMLHSHIERLSGSQSEMINATSHIEQASSSLPKGRSPLPVRAYLFCSLALLLGAAISICLGFENTQSFRTLTSLVPLAIGGILSLTAVIIATKKWERENLRVLHAKEASPLIAIRNRDERRQARRAAHLFGHDRAVAGIFERWNGPAAGVDVFGSELVSAQRVRDAADNRELVGALGQVGQVLTDLDARHIRLDRAELAADLRRGVGLEIERVHVRRTARQVDEDGGFRSGSRGDFAGGCQAEIARETQAGADSADFQKIASFDSVTGKGGGHREILEMGGG